MPFTPLQSLVALVRRAKMPSDSASTLGRSPSDDITVTSSGISTPIYRNDEKTADTGQKWPRDWRAYSCLTGCFFLMFNSWGLVNAYGTYASFYKQHLLPGRDILLMNLIGSTQCFIVLILSAVAGRLLDADYSRVLIGIGSILVPLGWCLLGVVNGEGQYNQGSFIKIWATQGVVSGLGMACFFVASSRIVATWFTKTRGIAIGIVASGASVAGLVYPLMTKELIKLYGFNRAVQYVAVLIFATCLVSFFCAVPGPGFAPRPIKRWSSLNEWVDMTCFRNKAFLFLIAGVSWMFFGFYAVFFNLEEWAEAKNIGYRDPTPDAEMWLEPDQRAQSGSIRTFWLLAIMNISSTVGRVSSGAFGDRIGALRLHGITTLVSSLLVLILWMLTTTVDVAIAFVVIFGIFSGAVIGLPPASVANVLEVYFGSQSTLGSWTGIMYMIAAIPALTGPVIAGHLITTYDSYYTVMGWSGACLLFASLCFGIGAWQLRKEAKSKSRRESNQGGGMFDLEVGGTESTTPTVVVSDTEAEEETRVDK